MHSLLAISLAAAAAVVSAQDRGQQRVGHALLLGKSKIDIDRYDEDVLLEEELYEPDPRDPAQVLADTRAKATTVRSFLAKGDAAGALNIVLDGAPYGQNVEEAKNTNLQTLLTILGSTKVPEIQGILKSLSQDSQDTLMKYLYKGMAMPSWGDSSWSVFLAWHEKLTEIAGIGCIVRVMTDKRTV
ncbi:ARC15_3 [Sanghuangporus vaninii]